MQMPLCFPEKITSGPAAIAAMGAVPECIGVKGVANAGGMMPEGEKCQRLMHLFRI